MKQFVVCSVFCIVISPAHAILKADGRFVKDPCGQGIIFRGVESVIGENFDEVAKSGANYVREMLWKTDETIRAEDLDRKIGKAVENGMFYCVSPWGHGANFVSANDWFNEPDIKAVLKKVDVVQTSTFHRVVLHWETAFGKDYKIQVSDDASSWNDLGSTTNGDGGKDTIAVEDASGRYVRIYDIRGRAIPATIGAEARTAHGIHVITTGKNATRTAMHTLFN